MIFGFAVNDVRCVTSATEVPLNHCFRAFLFGLCGLFFIFLLEVLLCLGSETFALSHFEWFQIGKECLLNMGSVLGFIKELLVLLQYLLRRGSILWRLL